MRYLLDPNAITFALKAERGKSALRIGQSSPRDVAVCSVVDAELYHGATKYGRSSRRESVLDAFLGPFQALPFDSACVPHYARVRDLLERPGKLIGGSDRMIAAIALTHGLTVAVQALPDAWQAAHGYPPLLAETFTDIEQFAGTCYQASGWVPCGLTKGFGRHRADFYQRHGRPKKLGLKPLHRHARLLLGALDLPAAYAPGVNAHSPERDQPQRVRTEGRVGFFPRVRQCEAAAAGRSDTAALRGDNPQQAALFPLPKIQENNDRGIADGGVVPGEFQTAGLLIHAEGGEVVGALVAHVEELTGGIKIEAARIISTGPFFTDES